MTHSCARCGTATVPGTRFCQRCGGPLPQSRPCPRCGAVAENATRFCFQCGSSLAEEERCGGCGTSFAPGSTFCSACGVPRAGPPAVPQQALALAPRRRGISRAAVAVAVAAILLLGGVMVILRAGETSPPGRDPGAVAARPTPLLGEAVAHELAQTAAQDLAQPPHVEEALRELYLRLGLESFIVAYRVGIVQVAFEQPDLPASHVQVVYLLVLDVAVLNAPFSQQVVITAKIGGEPLVSIAGQTTDITAFRRGELAQQEYFGRLAYSLGLR